MMTIAENTTPFSGFLHTIIYEHFFQIHLSVPVCMCNIYDEISKHKLKMIYLMIHKEIFIQSKIFY